MTVSSPRDAVISVGRVYCDLIFSGLPALPRMGREIFARSMRPTLGGGALIAAAHLASLGRRTALLASYGTDPLSLSLKPQMDETGIDQRFLDLREGTGPQVTVVMTGASDRAFLSCRAGDAVPPLFDDAIAWPRAALLHIAEYATLTERPDMIARARAKGLKVSLDPSWDDTLIGDKALLKACAGVDIFLPNAEEARAITGKTDLSDALDILALHFPVVAIKCGADGAHLAHGAERLSLPAPAVDVLDTTGAGDAFNAGFLNAWLGSLPLAQCLASGISSGSSSVQSIGGLPSTAPISDSRPTPRLATPV